MAELQADGDAYVVRLSGAVTFTPDPQRPARSGLDSDGRRYVEDGGTLRAKRNGPHQQEAGLDAARAVLGHKSANVTEVYAEIDTGNQGKRRLVSPCVF